MYKKVLITSSMLLATLVLGGQANADQVVDGNIDSNKEITSVLLEQKDSVELSVFDQRVSIKIPNHFLESDQGLRVLHNGTYAFSAYGSKSEEGISQGKGIYYYSYKHDEGDYSTIYKDIDGLENGDELSLETANGEVIQTIIADSVIHTKYDSLKVWKSGVGNSYSEGTNVIYNGNVYRTLQSHENKGDNDWNPESAPSLFKKVVDAPTLSMDGSKAIMNIPTQILASRNGYKVLHNGVYAFSVYGLVDGGPIGYYSSKTVSGRHTQYSRNLDNVQSGDEISLITENGDVFQTIIVE